MDEVKESPELLNDQAKEYLLSLGIQLDEDFSKIYYSMLNSTLYTTMYLSDKKLDREILQLAQENGISFLSLDDRQTVYKGTKRTGPNTRTNRNRIDCI